MNTINATVQNRRLELDALSDWPDGTQVEVRLLGSGFADESDTLSAVEIVAALAAMDAIEPFEMSGEEIASWEAERKARS